MLRVCALLVAEKGKKDFPPDADVSREPLTLESSVLLALLKNVSSEATEADARLVAAYLAALKCRTLAVWNKLTNKEYKAEMCPLGAQSTLDAAGACRVLSFPYPICFMIVPICSEGGCGCG